MKLGPTQAEVDEIYSPYSEIISGHIVRAAWEAEGARIRGEEPIRHRLREATIATLVHDLLHSHLESEFAGHESIEHHDKNGLRYLLIEDKLVVRFHALDANGRPSINPTRQTRKFHIQKLQLDLKAILKRQINLIVGYVIDDAKCTISAIRLLLPNGKGYAWKTEIAVPVFAEVRHIPQAETEAAPDTRKLLVVDKQPLQGEENVNGGSRES